MVREHWKTCLFSAIYCLCATFASADQPTETHPQGEEIRIAVLQNGNVMRGRLVPDGDFIEIQTEGAAIRLRKSQIMFDAASLLDAYEQQRSSVDRPTAEKHLELADWCMQQKLWPQAAMELLEARGLDATHPRMELLEQRLTFLVSQMHRSEAPVAESDTELSGPELTMLQEQLPQEKMVEAEIASHLPDKLPPGTLELFTRRVQPMLVNNCTSVGCHREEGPCEFQLSRALLYGESNRRTTRQNLQATLEFIDLQVPIDSRLLTIPLRTHGGTEGTIFPPHRRQLYDQLVAWVKLATADEQAVLADSQPRHTSAKNSATPIPITPLPATSGGDRYGSADGTFNGVARAAYFQPRSARRGSPRIQFGARHPANQSPRFLDPETLSRRIATEEIAVEPAPQAAAQEEAPPQEPTPQPIVDTGEQE